MEAKQGGAREGEEMSARGALPTEAMMAGATPVADDGRRRWRGHAMRMGSLPASVELSCTVDTLQRSKSNGEMENGRGPVR